jgi:endonuclease-3
MTERTPRTDSILQILKQRYPVVRTALKHRTPFQLLVATILSAQCTDKQVNAVTGPLFRTYQTPADFAAARQRDLEAIIRPTGFFHMKAKHIIACAGAIQETHGGKVPADLGALTALPGVGRKTANVVLGAAFSIPAMVVDTHVARISRRLDLTGHTDPKKIESDLETLVPKEDWNDFSLQLIYFGREICRARNPLCEKCPVFHLCEAPEKKNQ